MLIVREGTESESGIEEDSRQESEGRCDAKGGFPWSTEVYYNNEIRN